MRKVSIPNKLKTAKITTPLLWRVVIFLGLFVAISGLIGSRIIGGQIMFRDGFALYGGVGKAAVFGLIAFVLLIKHKNVSVTLFGWRWRQLAWLAVTVWLTVVAWMSVTNLLAGDRTNQNLTLAHGGMLLGVVTAALATFDLRNIMLLCNAFKREIIGAVSLAAGFYVFLIAVYGLWKVLASVVLISVDSLLNLSQVATIVIQPNTLMTDKFGITVAQYCSGIESIALFTALYAIVGILDRQKLNMQRFLWVFPLALLLLFGLNIIRVYALVMAGYHINPEIAFSLFHTYAGMVFFILYSVAFWLIAYKYLLIKVPQEGSDG